MMNGTEFEFGRMMGQIVSQQDRIISLLEHQHAATMHMSEVVTNLPRMIGREGTPTATTSIRDITELLRASLPLGVLAMAVFGKSAWPQFLPLLRDAVMIAAGGGH
jgi:hypothetical protein